MKTKRRRTFGWLLALAAALVIMALSALIAAAHTTTITKADPAVGSTVAQSPAQVMAQFSEEVVSRGSTLKVLDASGKQVSQGDGKLDLNDPNHQTMLAALPSPLSDGVYTVQYHVVLTDGDATDDSYKFTVKSVETPAAQQATATTAPTAAPTAVATLTATTVPLAAAVAATAQPTAGSPGTLPSTGGRAGTPFIWLLAVLGIILLAFGLAVTLRRNARQEPSGRP